MNNVINITAIMIKIFNLAEFNETIFYLHVLQWLRSQYPPCPWDERACSNAVINGQIDTFLWLRSQNPPCPMHGNILPIQQA